MICKKLKYAVLGGVGSIVLAYGVAQTLFNSSGRPFFLQDMYFRAYHTLQDRAWTAPITHVLPEPAPCPMGYLNTRILKDKILNPAPWVTQQVEGIVSKYGQFSPQKVWDIYHAANPADFLVLFDIKNGVVTTHTRSNLNESCQYAVELYKGIFRTLSHDKLIPNLTFIFRFADRTYTDYQNKTTRDIVPFVAVTTDAQKHIDQDALLIPDWQNLESWSRLLPRLDIAIKEHPWLKKKNIVFWRGGEADVTGYRHKVVKLSHNMNHTPIDAQFTYGDLKTAPFLKPQDHMPYKYQLNIDGHTAAWERPVWQLYSNSVVLKQFSHLIQWYYPQIKAGEHFVDVGEDPEKLLTILSQYTDADLKKIAENATVFAKNNLMPEDMVAYIAVALRTYAKYQATSEAN